MKFREFVGEAKEEKIKKIVETNLGKTDTEHLKMVLRETLDGSKLDYYDLGFNLSKKNLKRVFDYIKSWFIRFHVPYKPVHPFLSLYTLTNLKNYDKVIKKLNHTKWGFTYKPKGTITVINSENKNFFGYGIVPEKNHDYIILDYFDNIDYSSIMEDFFHESYIDVYRKHCFIKLFEIKSGIFTHRMYEDMMYSCPPMPEVKLNNVYLIRR
jgi:hypothetical protein